MRAAAATAVISPLSRHLEEGVYLGGYGGYRSRRATGVHDDIRARALVLSDGAAGLGERDSTTFALVALDLVGISHAHLTHIQRQASRQTGIPVDNVLIASTHSHASSDLQGLWGGVPAAYKAHLRSQVIGAIKAAASNLRDVKGVAASTQVTGIVRNRRGWDHTDTQLTALQFRAEGGAPLATVVNFACHPTVTTDANVLVSCDFPHFLVTSLERELGGVAVYVNGAQGDANPAKTGDFEEARRFGETVAAATAKALRDGSPLEPPLRLRSQTIHIPLGTEQLPTAASLLLSRGGPLLRAAASSGTLGWLARRMGRSGPMRSAQIVAALAMVSEQGIVRRGGLPHVPTRVAALGLGPTVRGLTAPGEALTRLALPIKELLDSPHRLFLGLTYDSLGYLLPTDEWMTGRNNNYEESVSLGPRAGPTVADALRGLVASAGS